MCEEGIKRRHIQRKITHQRNMKIKNVIFIYVQNLVLLRKVTHAAASVESSEAKVVILLKNSQPLFATRAHISFILTYPQ